MFYRDYKINKVKIEVEYIFPVGEEDGTVDLFIKDDYFSTSISFDEEFLNETKEKLLNLLQKKIKTYSKIFKTKHKELKNGLKTVN